MLNNQHQPSHVGGQQHTPPAHFGGQQQAAGQALGQAVHTLSLQIYVQLATASILQDEDIDPERLQKIARGSNTAAKAYFEGLGLARFGEATS